MYHAYRVLFVVNRLRVSYKCIVYIRSRPTFRGPLFLEVRGACTT